jgi:hypothetical protein
VEHRTEVLWSNRPLNATDSLFDPRSETREPVAASGNETPCEAVVVPIRLVGIA